MLSYKCVSCNRSLTICLDMKSLRHISPPLSWICVLIFCNISFFMFVFRGDAQPDGLSRAGDEIPDGFPNNHDAVAICREMAAGGIILYCVGCEPALRPYRDFFMGLCLITGGQYIRVQRANSLSRVCSTYVTKYTNFFFNGARDLYHEISDRGFLSDPARI